MKIKSIRWMPAAWMIVAVIYFWFHSPGYTINDLLLGVVFVLNMLLYLDSRKLDREIERLKILEQNLKYKIQTQNSRGQSDRKVDGLLAHPPSTRRPEPAMRTDLIDKAEAARQNRIKEFSEHDRQVIQRGIMS